jgi:hypothetical protein
MAEKKWMQKVTAGIKKRGTEGSFTRSAKAAGKSVAEYAKEKAGAGGKLGKRARLALAFRKARRGSGRR